MAKALLAKNHAQKDQIKLNPARTAAMGFMTSAAESAFCITRVPRVLRSVVKPPRLKLTTYPRRGCVQPEVLRPAEAILQISSTSRLRAMIDFGIGTLRGYTDCSRLCPSHAREPGMQACSCYCSLEQHME
jgi:hypothetical protein